MNVEHFRIAREAKGLGINAFARAISVSPTAVSNWQNGKSKPKPDLLEKIAEALDVDAAFLNDTSGETVAIYVPPQRVAADVLKEAKRELAAILGLPEKKIHLDLRIST